MDIRSTCTRQCRHPSARMRHFPPRRHIPGARRCPSARRGSLRKYNPSDGRCPTCHVAILFDEDVMEKPRDICGMAVNGRAIPRREHVRGRCLPRRHPWMLTCRRHSTCTATTSRGAPLPAGAWLGRPRPTCGHPCSHLVSQQRNGRAHKIRLHRTSLAAGVHRGGHSDIHGVCDMCLK